MAEGTLGNVVQEVSREILCVESRANTRLRREEQELSNSDRGEMEADTLDRKWLLISFFTYLHIPNSDEAG